MLSNNVPFIAWPSVLLIVLSSVVDCIASSPSLSSRSTEGRGVSTKVHFRTQPTFVHHTWPKIFKAEHALLDPGYIFLALMREPNDYGPRIYDSDGELVWYGSPFTKQSRISDFHPCDSVGADKARHLCWHDREPPPPGGSRSDAVYKKVWLDSSYELVRNLTTSGDQHEFNVVDNGSKYLTVNFRKKRWDLRPYCGKEKGWISDACIIEYDVETGEKTWDWCLTDHLPIYVATVYPEADEACQHNDTTPKAGKGTKDWPWDIGHLNAIDKDSNGDYIASFRHLDEIMKIAGPAHPQSGSILWRLGGRGNEFESNFNFSRQHMVRIADVTEPANSKTALISLFNNAWEGVLQPSAERSSGKVLRLHTDTRPKKAELVHEYAHPDNKLAESRGSMQVLPNRNAFVGWGTLPEVSEYSENGTLLYHMQFAPFDSGQYSYRAVKAPWVGRPSYPLKLVAYAQTCKSPIFAYVSWNGATEVRHWRFTTRSTESGPAMSVVTVGKTGFETQMRLHGLSSAVGYVFVEALDSEANVLGTGLERVFVPGPLDDTKCDLEGCPHGFAYSASQGQICKSTSGYFLRILGLLAYLGLVECCTTLACFALDRTTDGRAGASEDPTCRKSLPLSVQDARKGVQQFGSSFP